MTVLPYSIARMRMQPGDAILTADPAIGARFIRLWTGDEWSHIAAVVDGPPVDGKRRVYVAEAHLSCGIQRMLLSDWLAALRGRACWIPAGLVAQEKWRFTHAAEALYGQGYEGAWDFVRQSLGFDAEHGPDKDKICSAFYAHCFDAATGLDIPGRPWFRWALPLRRRKCVPTPGAVVRFLGGLDCEPVELIRG